MAQMILSTNSNRTQTWKQTWGCYRGGRREWEGQEVWVWGMQTVTFGMMGNGLRLYSTGNSV